MPPSRHLPTSVQLTDEAVRAPLLRLLFITGTDTGVGKTLLSALLLSHLRQRGVPALALKPFSCGDRSDSQLLHALLDGDLELNEINPFHFPEPVAPIVAARKHRRLIPLDAVLDHIASICSRRLPVANAGATRAKIKIPATLLIEGVGGLLVPLGEGYTLLDLITELARKYGSSPRTALEIVVVSRDQLGTLNHTLLTMQALPRGLAPVPLSTSHVSPSAGDSSLTKVVLMASRLQDPSSASNRRILSELLAPSSVIRFPFLNSISCTAAAIATHARRLAPLLARILA